MVGLPSKVKLCYIVFILLLVAGVLTYVSGFVLWLALPRGHVRSRSLAENVFLGLSKSSWENIHIASALILLALTFIHIALNWSWIKNVTRCLITSRGREHA